MRTCSSSPAIPASSTPGGRRRRRRAGARPSPRRSPPPEVSSVLVMDDDGTSHGLGRERPRAQRARGARDLSRRHARRDRGRAARICSATRCSVRTATLDQPEHGLTDGGPGRDRRPDVVGPHRPRRGRRRGRRPRARRRARRDGPARAALGALLEDPQAPARHLLQPALAQRGRARAGVDGRPVAPDRGRRPAPDRDRRAGDVRRALRHPGARRARLHLVASRAARCSAAAAASRAARAGSSTSAPATRTTPSTTTPTSSACWPTRCCGPRPARAAPSRTRRTPRDWYLTADRPPTGP